jgi:protein TonB
MAQPLYKKNPPPEYPRKARRRGYQGIVTLAVLVDVDGHAKKLKVARGSGYRLLDRAAVRSVRNWEFEPGSKNGHCIEMWVEVPIRFRLRAQ